MERKKSFKPTDIIFLALSAIFTGGLGVTAVGLMHRTNPPFYVRLIVTLALFAVQLFLYLKYCKYNDLMNSTRQCEPFEKKWSFYMIAFTSILYLIAFGGLLIFLSLIVIQMWLMENILGVFIFAIMLSILGAYLIIGVITRIYSNVRSAQAIIIE